MYSKNLFSYEKGRYIETQRNQHYTGKNYIRGGRSMTRRTRSYTLMDMAATKAKIQELEELLGLINDVACGISENKSNDLSLLKQQKDIIVDNLMETYELWHDYRSPRGTNVIMDDPSLSKTRRLLALEYNRRRHAAKGTPLFHE